MRRRTREQKLADAVRSSDGEGDVRIGEVGDVLGELKVLSKELP